MSKHAEMDEKQTTLLFIRAKRGGRHLGIGSDLIVGMKNLKYIFQDAEMAELVDAIDSKSIDRKVMRVRVPLSAPEVTCSELEIWSDFAEAKIAL